MSVYCDGVEYHVLFLYTVIRRGLLPSVYTVTVWVSYPIYTTMWWDSISSVLTMIGMGAMSCVCIL